MLRTMAVVGTGLIGTSVALAARRLGVTVYLSDIDESAAHTAAALGAGTARTPADPVELAVLAVPPSRVGRVFAEWRSQDLALSYTDVASVKSGPEREVRAAGAGASCYVGGHPMAGRERSGPLAARADLFRGRPWVLTPSGETDPGTIDRAVALVDLCGAVPVMMPSAAHDRAVALTSHVPHLVATLMAARLLDGPAGAARLTGQGLRDVTRIAGGDSRLWSDILDGNAPAVLRILRDLHADLAGLLRALEDLTAPYDRDRARGMDALVDLLDRGIAGQSAIAADPVVRPGTPGT